MPPPDLSDRDFKKQVADALKHLWDFSYLGTHPLAQLKSVKRRLRNRYQATHVVVGRTVSEVLRAAIEDLKPIDEQRDFSREKHYYSILTMAYVEGVQNKAIADSLNIGERTLYRYTAKAVQCVSQILRELDVGDDASL